jgi:hypothetical protein
MKEFHAMSFGFGEIICPNCYNHEEEFIFLDESYLLNKLIVKNVNPQKVYRKMTSIESTKREIFLNHEDKIV